MSTSTTHQATPDAPIGDLVDSNGAPITARFLESDRFHYVGANGKAAHNPCTRTVGTRGAIKEHTIAVRRMGATKLWKTRPTHFRIPVKFGMYESTAITHENAHQWHTEDTCPLAPRFFVRSVSVYSAPSWDTGALYDVIDRLSPGAPILSGVLVQVAYTDAKERNAAHQATPDTDAQK